MKNDYLFDIILKAFGIYCFMVAITQSSMLCVSFFVQPETYFKAFTNKSAYFFSQLPFLAIHFLLSYLFLFKAQHIINIINPSKNGNKSSEEMRLNFITYSFCIKIIGLFYFVKSTSVIAAHAVELVIIEGTISYLYSGGSFIPNIITLIISFFFISKSQYIENLITKKDANSQPDGSVNS